MEKRFFLRQGSLQIPCILTVPEQAQPQQVVLGVHGLGGSARDTIQTGIAQEMDIFCNATVRFDFYADPFVINLPIRRRTPCRL